MESSQKLGKLPALRVRLEAEISDPYQVMAAYQRQRHYGQEGEEWPEVPADTLAVTKYPNILAEFEASGFWLDLLARGAGVSQAIMASVMESGGEMSWQEFERLARRFKCKLAYLTSPVLSMVDPTTNKGKGQLRRLKDLVQQTSGMDLFLYHTYSRDVLPKMEAGKPVTYAAYRWACNRLQDLLDSRAREAVRQQRIRTGALSEEKESAADNATLHDRVQRIRLRNSMQATQRRLWEIRAYVDSTKPVNSTGFSTTTKDLLALEEFSKRDLYGAFLLAVAYGQAMGYRAATMEAGR